MFKGVFKLKIGLEKSVCGLVKCAIIECVSPGCLSGENQCRRAGCESQICVAGSVLDPKNSVAGLVVTVSPGEFVAGLLVAG